MLQVAGPSIRGMSSRRPPRGSGYQLSLSLQHIQPVQTLPSSRNPPLWQFDLDPQPKPLQPSGEPPCSCQSSTGAIPIRPDGDLFDTGRRLPSCQQRRAARGPDAHAGHALHRERRLNPLGDTEMGSHWSKADRAALERPRAWVRHQLPRCRHWGLVAIIREVGAMQGDQVTARGCDASDQRGMAPAVAAVVPVRQPWMEASCVFVQLVVIQGPTGHIDGLTSRAPASFFISRPWPRRMTAPMR